MGKRNVVGSSFTLFLLTLSAVHCGGGESDCVRDCETDNLAGAVSGDGDGDGDGGGTGSGGVAVGTGGENTDAGGSNTGGKDSGTGGSSAGGTGGTTPAELDASWGTQGVVSTWLRDSSDEIIDAASMPDGRFVAVATRWGQKAVLVYRFMADGSPDTSFNNVGSAIVPMGQEAKASAVDVQSDGRVLVLAYDISGGQLTRLNSDGSLDTTWGTNGVLSLGGRPGGMVVQADDKVLVAYGSPSGFAAVNVQRLTANGTADNSFAGGVAQMGDPAKTNLPIAVGLDSSNRVVVLYHVFGKDLMVARLTAVGALDTTFGVDGIVDTTLEEDTSAGHPLGILADDGILVAGEDLSKSPSNLMARLDSDGNLETSFDTDGYTETWSAAQVEDIVLRGSGANTRVYLLRGGADNADDSVSCYKLDGSLDDTFGISGRAALTTRRSHALLFDQSDRLLVAGAVRTRPPAFADSYFQAHFLGLSGSGAVDATWADSGDLWAHARASSDEIRVLHVSADGGLLAGGLSSINGSLGPGFVLAKYSASGSVDATFGEAGIVYVDEPDSTILARDLAEDSNGRIVVTGGAASTTMRFSADGSIDTSFGTAGTALLQGSTGSNYSYALAVDATDRVLVAGAANVTGGRTGFIVRASAAGVKDSTFGTAGNVNFGVTPTSGVLDIALQSDGKILTTGVGSVGLLSRRNEDGSADDTFVATDDASGVGRSLLELQDNKIVVVGSTLPASFVSDLDQPSDGNLLVAKFLANGSPDETFANAGVLITDLAGTGVTQPDAYSVQEAADGTLYVAGSANVAGARRGIFLRVLADGSVDATFGTQGVLVAPLAGRESSIFSLTTWGERLVGGGYVYLNPTGRDLALVGLKP